MEIRLSIFSPRWGHEDEYKVVLDQNSMTITLNLLIAKCERIPGSDPEWTDDRLIKMMNNDSIYPPHIIPRLFEYAWEAWINNEIDDTQLKDELNEVANWISTVAKNKPNTEFWNKYF